MAVSFLARKVLTGGKIDCGKTERQTRKKTMIDSRYEINHNTYTSMAFTTNLITGALN